MIQINFKELKKLTIYEITEQAKFTINREILLFYNKNRDKFFSTQIKVKLHDKKKSYIVPDLSNLNVESIEQDIARELCHMYLNHRFDLLGSGWVRCGFFDNAPGVEGYKYSGLVFEDGEDWLLKILDEKDYKYSKKIYNLVSKEYVPIDWQKDYKTGYRWTAKEWYRPIKIAKELGVDIKVPWELARMQHLPRLALFYKMFPEISNKIKQEYMDECLDFIAQNPIRKGVNWMCTMDVAIRIANIVLAYWLFCSFKADFTKRFEDIIGKAVYEHCKHIRNNLEWSVRIRSNHYFSNICGLLYGAAFLGHKEWIGFARNQYEKELLQQFYEEGSNFEGSIGYHRLSGEMAIYTASLIEFLAHKGLCRELSETEKKRIVRIGMFAQDTMTPDGSYVQIGDNDSGRFFNLTPLGTIISSEEAKGKYVSLRGYVAEDNNEQYFDEHINSPKQLIEACKAFNQQAGKKYSVEKEYIEFLLNRKVCKLSNIEFENKKIMNSKVEKLQYETVWEIGTKKSCNLMQDLYVKQYPQFGVYIFKSHNLYMCVNATDNGQKGNAGHAHNDKLSFELWIGGEPIVQDPGTYLYTAILEERERFRSVKAHNTLQCGVEQNEYRGTFSMSNDTKCKLLNIEENSIELQVEFKDIVQRRKIQICENKIIIRDSSNQEFTVNKESEFLTNGYGKLLRKRERR